MQIVIEIPKKEYEDIIHDEACGLHPLTRAIAKGTPLPEHHGNLKDEIEIIKSLFDYHKGIKTIGQCIESVPTIIPATKEGDGE